MSELTPGSSAEKESRFYPLLTEDQKRALIEDEDKGVIPAPMKQFSDFEEWRSSPRKDFYQNWFYPGAVNDFRRQMQCFQRFELLYPELREELGYIVTKHVDTELELDTHIKMDDETKLKLYDAYTKLSALVDIRDVGINNGNKDIAVDPYILLR